MRLSKWKLLSCTLIWCCSFLIFYKRFNIHFDNYGNQQKSRMPGIRFKPFAEPILGTFQTSWHCPAERITLSSTFARRLKPRVDSFAAYAYSCRFGTCEFSSVFLAKNKRKFLRAKATAIRVCCEWFHPKSCYCKPNKLIRKTRLRVLFLKSY